MERCSRRRIVKWRDAAAEGSWNGEIQLQEDREMERCSCRRIVKWRDAAAEDSWNEDAAAGGARNGEMQPQRLQGGRHAAAETAVEGDSLLQELWERGI